MYSQKQTHVKPAEPPLVQGEHWRLSKVLAYSGLSRSEIYRQRKDGKFPAPVQIGIRAIAWKSADVIAWADSLEVATR